MILVSDIEPLDFLSTYKKISDIEIDYPLIFQSNYKPKEVLDKAIRNKNKGRSSKKKKAEIAILTYLLKNFDDLIVKKPKELSNTILYFNRKGWQAYIYNNDKATVFGKQLLEIFGYSKKFRSQVKRGIWLARQLNLKSCPYCNAQYTIIANSDAGKAIAKFQFDHFFSKDEFPYLSLSLYNLIPSCANCNITKSKKQLNIKDHYHPYFLDFSVYFKFYLKYKPDPNTLTIRKVKAQNLEIELVPRHVNVKAFVDEHNKLYHIKGVYDRHQDIAEDLLIKAIIYTKHLQKSHLKIKGLFPDRTTYLRYLLGNYANNKDILKRPLTKFTQDIAKQLKII